MNAFGAIVLADGVDAVTFLEMVLGHPVHIVLDDLRHLLRRLAGQSLHSKSKTDGRRKGGSGSDTIHAGYSCWASLFETHNNRFGCARGKVTLYGANNLLRR